MKIISVHFPKAGGSSLRVQIERLMGESLLLDYGHDPLGRFGKETVHELPPGIRMVHGHFRAARYAIGDAFRFTFLREPVENPLSHYFFWQKAGPFGSPWHSKFLSEWPTIVEFARYEPLRNLMSEGYFGGYDMSRFDFVGFNETRIDDYARLGTMLGLTLDGALHTNRMEGSWTERAAIKHDARISATLRSLLANDLRFYEKQRAAWR